MFKKIVIEKIFLFFTITLIGVYSVMSMLATNDNSMLETSDPLLLKLIVGILFVLSTGYCFINFQQVHMSKIGWLLLVISSYMAIVRIIDLPITAGLFAYFYQPMRDLLIVILFLFVCTIASKSKDLLNFFVTSMFVAMLIMVYFYYKNWTIANELDEAHLGTSYYVLFMLPIILLTPYKWIRYMALIITMAVLFSSFKRGGLIAFVLGIIAYLFVKEVLIERKFKRLIFFIIAIFTLLIALVVVDNIMGNIISSRILNIREDGGSGRDQVWFTTWNMIQKSYGEQFVFGHGYNATEKLSPLGLSAHNDFLEMLFNYGVISFVFYVILHIQLIKQVFAEIRKRNKAAPAMAFTYTIFFLLSMISHVIVYPWASLIAMSWGAFNSVQKDTSTKTNITT